MKEIDIDLEPIEKQLEFWQSFVEGMSKALHETRKAYREKCQENTAINKKLSDSYKDGVRDCINSLRELQDQYRHESRWNHSGQTKFAPVELSDYLLRDIYNKPIN